MNPNYVAALEQRIGRMAIELTRAEATVQDLEAQLVEVVAERDALKLDHTDTD